MSEKEKPFTVNDRRHFTPDGRAREEQPEAPAQGPGLAAASTPAGPASPAPDPAPPPPGPTPAPAAGPVDFTRFVLSLGAQAGMMLAGEPGGEGEADALEGARQIISILEMLQGKTEGRRIGEESRILEDLLFQLRMAYVARAKR
jgi:hypothetical protein